MATQKENLSKESLMELYSDYLLTHGRRPANVYVFAKDNGFEESDFYEFFSGFDSLEGAYFTHFFEKSVELARQIEDFDGFEAKEKLLNLYYILVENLNLNRSLILFLLKGPVTTRFHRLAPLRKQFLEFIGELDIKEWSFLEKAPKEIKQIKTKSREEILWVHFVSVLKFWKNDRSAGFEDTDIYIEKSINAGFSIIETPVVEQLFDLGKFLWKQHC